ncbi:hypothetical protein KC358_g55 [Hortaea werneckii]|nr:hypothetical protein KC358_g55 [Hortaea werneckii]
MATATAMVKSDFMTCSGTDVSRHAETCEARQECGLNICARHSLTTGTVIRGTRIQQGIHGLSAAAQEHTEVLPTAAKEV